MNTKWTEIEIARERESVCVWVEKTKSSVGNANWNRRVKTITCLYSLLSMHMRVLLKECVGELQLDNKASSFLPSFLFFFNPRLSYFSVEKLHVHFLLLSVFLSSFHSLSILWIHKLNTKKRCNRTQRVFSFVHAQVIFAQEAMKTEKKEHSQYEYFPFLKQNNQWKPRGKTQSGHEKGDTSGKQGNKYNKEKKEEKEHEMGYLPASEKKNDVGPFVDWRLLVRGREPGPLSISFLCSWGLIAICGHGTTVLCPRAYHNYKFTPTILMKPSFVPWTSCLRTEQSQKNKKKNNLGVKECVQESRVHEGHKLHTPYFIAIRSAQHMNRHCPTGEQRRKEESKERANLIYEKTSE